MDNYRLVLIASLALVLMLIYQAWDKEVARPSTATAPATGQAATVSERAPTTNSPAEVPTPRPGPGDTHSNQPSIQAETAPPITVETDVLRVQIALRGGTVASAWLLEYAVSPETPENKVRLLKPDVPNLFVAQTGLIGNTADLLPTHEALFSSAEQQYRLGDRSTLDVVLNWKSETGVEVRKTLRFKRGSYVVEVIQEVHNATDAPVVARDYAQLQRTALQDPNAPRFVSTYTGGVYYTPSDKYKKVTFSNMTEKKLEVTASDGWVAMIQHYFLGAWVPARGIEQSFYTNVIDGTRYIIGSFSTPVTIPPGATHTFSDQLFIGPKLPDALAALAPGLDLTVDYGALTVIAQPIHWLLDAIYSVVGNWGWSIIVLTILIKLAFYKLSETSYKSMANMRQLAPRLAALKDRYGDDKERLNQAMMELYKTEKINPLGGCLPILVQIPVFIALYWVLLESVELRQAPFILWIDNLSAPDPYFVLPVIMGISMYVQSKLNPAPPDPVQAKIMMSLPFIFTVFFAFFPSGLVLYWTVNNVLSIAQQWYITQSIEKEAAKRKR